MAETIAKEFENEIPVFIVVLNGASFFAIDLLKNYSGQCHITFLQLSSYEGTSSTGKVKAITKLPGNISGKHVIILEDIVDTGLTINYLKSEVEIENPASVLIVSLLDKPSKRLTDVEVDMVGFTIPDVFVVGYGLDYDELGRNTKDIFSLKPD